MGTINDYLNFHALFQGYSPSDQDVDSSDADTQYTGYVDKEGHWYILKEDRSVSGDADVISWRYAKGNSSYSTNWTNRESLTYARFDQTFA